MSSANIAHVREVKLFKNRSNQAVRIPVDFAFDVDRVRIRRDGEKLILEPLYENGLVALLDGWDPLDENFPDVADEISKPEEIF